MPAAAVLFRIAKFSAVIKAAAHHTGTTIAVRSFTDAVTAEFTAHTIHTDTIVAATTEKPVDTTVRALATEAVEAAHDANHVLRSV